MVQIARNRERRRGTEGKRRRRRGVTREGDRDEVEGGKRRGKRKEERECAWERRQQGSCSNAVWIVCPILFV